MSFLGDIFDFLTGLSGIFDQIEQLVGDIDKLVLDVRLEKQKIEHFKHDPKWKSRVINVPAAIQKTRELVLDVVGEVQTSWQALANNLRHLKHPAPVAPGEKPGVAGVLNLITEINNFVGEVDQAVKGFDGFVEAMKKITEELESLDSIFLQQGNSRRKEKNASPRIRIGALHG